MTVTTTDNANYYTGNGVTTVFAYTFQVFDDSNIEVLLDSVVVTTGFTIFVNANQQTTPGGTVTFDVAPDPGVEIALIRTLPLTQEVDYTEYDPFPAETHEGALDKLTMLLQDLLAPVAGGFGFSGAVSDAGETKITLDAVQRALRVLGFDSAGDLQALTVDDIATGLTFSNFKSDEFVDPTDFTPGVTDQLILSNNAAVISNTNVFFDGVYQGKSQYTLAGDGITVDFTSPIPVGVSVVEINYGTSLPQGQAAEPTDDSVSTQKIQDGAVTTPKLVDSAVTEVKMDPALVAEFRQPRKNAIINGNFDVWQRGTIKVIPNSGVTYVADRWRFDSVGEVNAECTVERVTDVPNNDSTYALKNTTSRAVGASFPRTEQQIEVVSGDLSGKNFVFSFWLKSVGTPDAVALIVNDSGAGITQPTVSNDWQKVVIPYNLFSAGNPKIAIQTTTNGAGQGHIISQVQLEKGSEASEFEVLPIEQIIALCQRYYVELQEMHMELRSSTGNRTATMFFPTEMRVAPSASNLTSSSGTPSVALVGTRQAGLFVTLANTTFSVNFVTATFDAEL